MVATLDAIREVQERLKQNLSAQWTEYVWSFSGDTEAALHATAGQKIAALAAVLRPLVTKDVPRD